jgi:hypothetical protein
LTNVLTAGGCLAVAVGCSSLDAEPRPVDQGADLFERLTADPGAPSDDLVEIWVCAVPETTTNPLYGDADLRLMLSPQDVVARIGERVSAYFATVSFDRYRVELRPGGIVPLADGDGAEECADAALDQASDEADVVLAVANAEHAEGKAGGWGRPGTWFECRAGVPDEPAADRECPASATRRAAYIGASDFSPAWGAVPLLDLVQHELGHALGLPHSGILVGMATGPESSELVYSSALDLMSNSAAAHDADPTRRDGPDTLGINRYDLGWLEAADVLVVDPSELVGATPTGGRIELELAGASTPVQGGDASSRTPRLAVVRLGTDRVPPTHGPARPSARGRGVGAPDQRVDPRPGGPGRAAQPAPDRRRAAAHRPARPGRLDRGRRLRPDRVGDGDRAHPHRSPAGDRGGSRVTLVR